MRGSEPIASRMHSEFAEHYGVDPALHLLLLVVRAVQGLVRDDKAPWSKPAGKNGQPAAGPVRADDAADRRAGDRLSVLTAHHR